MEEFKKDSNDGTERLVHLSLPHPASASRPDSAYSHRDSSFLPVPSGTMTSLDLS